MQPVYQMQPIGSVQGPYEEAAQIPKGCGARHEAEGVLEILPEYEQGLTDIEGFSHLYVLWVFDRVEGFDLLATPPTDTRPHGVFATRMPRRPNPLGLTVVELVRREGARLYVKGMTDDLKSELGPELGDVDLASLRYYAIAEGEVAGAALEPVELYFLGTNYRTAQGYHGVGLINGNEFVHFAQLLFSIACLLPR